MDGTAGAGFEVQPLQTASRDATAALHRAELPDSFFAALGPRFLRAYHDSFAASPYGVALVAVGHGGGILGFVVGTCEDRDHYRWVVRSFGWRLAAIGALSLLVRPRLALRFTRTRLRRYARGAGRLARRSMSPATAAAAPALRVGSLVHIAVQPGARHEGVGRRLASSFVAGSIQGGAQRLQVKTEANDAGAGDFYRALGWQHVAVLQDLEGRPFDRFVLDS